MDRSSDRTFRKILRSSSFLQCVLLNRARMTCSHSKMQDVLQAARRRGDAAPLGELLFLEAVKRAQKLGETVFFVSLTGSTNVGSIPPFLRDHVRAFLTVVEEPGVWYKDIPTTPAFLMREFARQQRRIWTSLWIGPGGPLAEAIRAGAASGCTAVTMSASLFGEAMSGSDHERFDLKNTMLFLDEEILKEVGYEIVEKQLCWSPSSPILEFRPRQARQIHNSAGQAGDPDQQPHHHPDHQSHHEPEGSLGADVQDPGLALGDPAVHCWEDGVVCDDMPGGIFSGGTMEEGAPIIKLEQWIVGKRFCGRVRGAGHVRMDAYIT